MNGIIDLLFENADKKEIRSIINNMHEIATIRLAEELSEGEEKYDSDVVIVAFNTQINEEYSFALFRAMALDMYREDTHKRAIITEFLDSLQELYNKSEEITRRF